MLKSVKGVYTGSEVTLLEPVEEKAPCDVIVTFLDTVVKAASRQALIDTCGAWADDPALDDIWAKLRADRDQWGSGPSARPSRESDRIWLEVL